MPSGVDPGRNCDTNLCHRRIAASREEPVPPARSFGIAAITAVGTLLWAPPVKPTQAQSAAPRSNVHTVAQATRKPPSHRSQRQGMFALTRIKHAAVVMLGDSLTERGQWAEITGCYFVANRGVGSDDTAGVLKRLDDVTGLSPRAVFLMIGVNDVASQVPTARIVENIQRIAEVLRAADARVYLTLVLPVTQGYARKINAKVAELNDALLHLKGVDIIDMRDKVATADGYLREELSIDGIHLSPDGYRIWRDEVLPLVERHCQPPPVPPPPIEVRRERRQ